MSPRWEPGKPRPIQRWALPGDRTLEYRPPAENQPGDGSLLVWLGEPRRGRLEKCASICPGQALSDVLEGLGVDPGLLVPNREEARPGG